MPPRHPQALATTPSPPRARRLDPFRVCWAHFGVMQDHIFFDGEAFSLMAPLNMDPKVSAKRPSHPPQPHPLLTFALPLAPYFVPSGRLWQSIFFGRFTLFDGFNGETAPCSMGLQTFSLRGVV